LLICTISSSGADPSGYGSWHLIVFAKPGVNHSALGLRPLFCGHPGLLLRLRGGSFGSTWHGGLGRSIAGLLGQILGLFCFSKAKLRFQFTSAIAKGSPGRGVCGDIRVVRDLLDLPP